MDRTKERPMSDRLNSSVFVGTVPRTVRKLLIRRVRRTRHTFRRTSCAEVSMIQPKSMGIPLFLSSGALFLLLLFCFGCSKETTDTITQASTIEALMAGAYDGSVSCAELLKNGDFGLGTFDRLDGEMIILKGEVLQVKADGCVYRPKGSLLSPFASVCYFRPEERLDIKDESDYQKTREIIDAAIPNNNIFYAIKIHGKFSRMKTRSVPAQTKPYPVLAEVTKNQPVFDLKDIEGTIVGFRCPAFAGGVNVTGYHFHFISDDLARGGHILDFVLEEGLCEIDACHRYLLVLPEGGRGLEGIDLSLDRRSEIEKVEK